ALRALRGPNLLRVALLLSVVLLLAACSQPNPVAPTASPTAVSIDTRTWQVLYQRDGGQRGATIDLRAVGDVMLGRNVGDIAARHTPDYPFAQVRTLLAGQLTIGNLESPLTDRTAPLRPGPYRLPASTSFAKPLKQA